MADIASLAIQIDTSDVARAENDLERLGTKGAKAEQAAKGVGDAYQQAAGKVGGVAGAATQAGTALERNSVAARENARELASVDRSASSLSGSMSKLGATLAGLTAGMSIKGIIDISDNYGQMADRIKMATDSTEEYRMVQERLLQSANRTYRPLAEGQELYIRTADAIRSLGYQTSDALDITDSFSYLLVTNATSADKASNAIDAYSKSIQSGRIEVDSWQSLIAAMPSLVDTLSGSLGKSAEEIRQLGITGKLSLADLNEGLRQTVEQNQKLADGMGTTLNDAIVRASNNLSTYLGESSKVTASSRLLSGALDGVTENIDLIATTLGGVAVAAVARYATVTAKSTAASVAQTIAAGRQAAEELKLAQAQVASATAAVALARANVGLTASTGQVTAALAAQEAAQKRLAAAQAASAGLGRTVLGLAGGWAGLAVTAGAVALSFVDWGDGAEEAARKSIALREETNLLTRAVEDLDAAQAKQVLQRMEEPYQAAKDEARNYAAQIEYLNAQLDRHPGSAKVEEWNRALVDAKGNLSTVNQELAAQEAKMRDLNARIEQNTNAWKAQREAASETDKEGQSFLASLQRRADLSGKLTEVQKTQIAIEKGYAGVLSETAKQEALAAAAVIDRANAALNAGKGVDEQARAFKALYDSLYPAEAAQRQYNDQVKLLKQYLSGDQLANAIYRLNHAIDGADATGPADAIEEYRKELERLEDKINPAGRAAREFADEQKRLRAEIERTGDPTGKWTRLLEENERQMRLNTEGVSVWAQMTEGAVDRVDSAFADMWKNVFDGTGNVLDGMKNAIKQWMAEVVHMLTTKALMTSVGNWLMGTNNAGGIGQVWGSLLGGGSSSGGGYGVQDGLSAVSTARNAYSLYTAGFAGMANTWGGYLAGAGNMLGMTGLGNFGIGMQGATLAPGLAGPTTIGAGGSMGAGAQVGSGLSSLGGVLSNPATWIAAGMLASWRLYDQGTRADGGAVMDRFRDTGSSSAATAFGGVLSGASYAVEFMDKLLVQANKILLPIGSAILGDKLTAVITGSPVTQAINMALARLFGGGERYERQVGSASGVYSGGEYTGLGAVESWFSGSRRFGDDFDGSLHDLNDAFASSLSGLFQMFDIESDISTETVARLRRTSGKLLASFTATFDDAVVEIAGQYSKKGRIEEAMQQFFDDVMGRGLAQAIGASQLPEYLKELTEGLTKAEEVSEAISGLFQRFDGVNSTIEALNFSAFELTDAGLRGADALLDLSAAIAGLENPTVVDQIASLGTLTSAYYENFFSETERTQHTLDAVARAFEQADVTLAGSRAEYRAMVEDIDLTTDAGRQMFATLMSLAGQAAQYYSIIEQQTSAALMGAVDSAYGRLQRSVQVERDRLTREYQAALAQEQAAQAAAQSAAQARSAALNDMAATANANAQALRSLGNELDRALRGLIGATESGAQMLRRQAVETLEEALALGHSGRSLASIEGLDKAVSSAAAVDKSIYSSLEDFEREQGRTANLIAELSKINGRQLTAEEKLAADLRASAASISISIGGVSSQLTADYQRAIAALDEEMAAAQSQLDALNGIDNSVRSVAEAIAQMSAAVTAAMGGQQAAIQQMYQSILGKPANDTGLQFWADRIGQSGNYTELYRELTQAAQGQAGTQNAIADLYKQHGQTADAEGVRFWSEAISSGQYSYDDLRRGLESMRVPAFARGGLHAGGLRLVGENGPELEVTGPSRIYNASQTAAMLGGAGSTEELRALRGEVAGLRSALGAIAKYTESTAYGVRQMNEIGLPQGEAA